MPTSTPLGAGLVTPTSAAIPSTTPTASPSPAPSGVASPSPTSSSVPATTTPDATATPTPIPCEVRVFEREPQEPFEFLGVVEVKRRSPAERPEAILESARLAACRMGADAIVVLFRANRRQGGIAQRPIPRAVLNDADLRAAVIRFRR